MSVNGEAAPADEKMSRDRWESTSSAHHRFECLLMKLFMHRRELYRSALDCWTATTEKLLTQRANFFPWSHVDRTTLMEHLTLISIYRLITNYERERSSGGAGELFGAFSGNLDGESEEDLWQSSSSDRL
jgi:hypothetical protein